MTLKFVKYHLNIVYILIQLKDNNRKISKLLEGIIIKLKKKEKKRTNWSGMTRAAQNRVRW